jgi:multidrug transporter EmrE-like cation transporter
MSSAAFFFLLTGVLLNAAAQLLLKAGTNRLGVVTLAPDTFATTLTRIAAEGHVVGGLVLYGISVLVWIAGLSRVPVSVAYPMLSLGYVVNALAAQYLFGEAVTMQRWLGIGFIVVGVWLVARSA